MKGHQRYRLRAPASGREATAEVEPDGVYTDRVTGEEMRVVSRLLPLSPSDSQLPRTPENLKECPRCNQLIGIDVSGCVSNCPFTALRQPADA
ncbi:MAG: hypothetical protein ACR2NA_12385 [Solirubrobacterales bacterium]